MELCHDLVGEILSRSSLETVAKCRLLSTSVRSLSYNSSILTRNAGLVHGYFLQQISYSNLENRFFSSYNTQKAYINPSLTILSSTDQGVLLCTNFEYQKIPTFFICKPLTDQYVKLPNPKTRYSGISYGIKVQQSKPLHFKIVRFSTARYSDSLCRSGKWPLRYEIFDSQLWKWKRAPMVFTEFLDNVTRKPGICAYGCLHWITYDNKILTANVDDETYGYVSLPDDIDKFDKLSLVKYRDKLAIISNIEGIVQWWVLENYENWVWVKKESICLYEIGLDEEGIFVKPIGLYGSNVLVIGTTRRIYAYDVDNKKILNVKEGSDMGYWKAFPFQSDGEKMAIPNQTDTVKSWANNTRKRESMCVNKKPVC